MGENSATTRVWSAAALNASRKPSKCKAATAGWLAGALAGTYPNSIAATRAVEHNNAVTFNARRPRPHWRARNACTKPTVSIRTSSIRSAAGPAAGPEVEFTSPDGTPLHPAAVTGAFEQLAYLAGLPPIRLHDLRHGAATLLLAAGHHMKVVQETLGLSSITIAADTYTSVLPELARRSAEDVAALIRLGD